MAQKGIKGRLITEDSQQARQYIQDNDEAFKAVINRDFPGCFIEYEMFEAEYQGEDVIDISFNILSHTAQEAAQYYALFKKELKNHFGFQLKEIVKAKYDKI